MNGTLEYRPRLKLHPGQAEVDAVMAPARFVNGKWDYPTGTPRFVYDKSGRRYGKSKYGVHRQILWALRCPNEEHNYVAPTYRMAEEIAWLEFQSQLPRDLILKKDERKLSLELAVGDPDGLPTRIVLKGSDKLDLQRGRRLGSLVMEEAAYQKTEVYTHVFRPMLADLRAPFLAISSPKRGWFVEAWKAAMKDETGRSRAFHHTIYDNPHISREEIEELRQNTPEHVWRQEYLAEEIEESGQVYTEFTRASIFDPKTKFQGHEAWPCVLGIDWGSWDETGVVWLHVSPQGFVVASAEHGCSGWDTRKHADVIRVRSRGRAMSPRDIVLDQSAFRREAKDHKSIADHFTDHFGHVLQKSERDAEAGIDLMKRYLRGDGKAPWLYVSSECPQLIRDLDGWEHGDHEPDRLAACRYALMHAVVRRLTKLTAADKLPIPVISAPDDDVLRLPPPKKSGPADWSWDGDFGVPQ